MFDLDKARRLINERKKELANSDSLLTLIMEMEGHLISLASWDTASFIYERDYSNALEEDEIYYADLQLRELYLRLRELFSLYATLEERGISLTTKLKDAGYETVIFSPLTGSIMLTEDSPYKATVLDASSLLKECEKELPPLEMLIRLFIVLQEETFLFPTIDFLEKLKSTILEVYK